MIRGGVLVPARNSANSAGVGRRQLGGALKAPIGEEAVSTLQQTLNQLFGNDGSDLLKVWRPNQLPRM